MGKAYVLIPGRGRHFLPLFLLLLVIALVMSLLCEVSIAAAADATAIVANSAEEVGFTPRLKVPHSADEVAGFSARLIPRRVRPSLDYLIQLSEARCKYILSKIHHPGRHFINVTSNNDDEL